jgi:NAD(P)H dehydrogenase (quinone)
MSIIVTGATDQLGGLVIQHLLKKVPASQIADILSEVAGKEVVHQSVSFKEEKAMLTSAGLPEPVAAMIAGIYHAISEGETARTSDDLQNLIGSLTPLKETVKQTLQS